MKTKKQKKRGKKITSSRMVISKSPVCLTGEKNPYASIEFKKGSS